MTRRGSRKVMIDQTILDDIMSRIEMLEKKVSLLETIRVSNSKPPVNEQKTVELFSLKALQQKVEEKKKEMLNPVLEQAVDDLLLDIKKNPIKERVT